jgi:hypothetical protein
MLMSSVVTGKGGGGAKGLKLAQFTLNMGPGRVEVCFFVQRATIPSMRVFFFAFVSATHAANIIYMLAMLYE